ncbi:MAG TPA: hypothetical protein VK524_08010 [Polyangiaceae bacterium]|nr:hypothetical protein [Polyangiaceae bacterium]
MGADPAAAAENPNPALGQTQLGYAPPDTALRPASGQRTPNPKTLLGLPALDPRTLAARQAPGAPPAAPPPKADPAQPARRLPSQFNTMIGVARPGIAPSNPGLSRSPNVTAASPVHLHPQFSHPVLPGGQRPVPEAPVAAPVRPRRRRLAWGGALVLVAAVSLLTLATVVLLTRRSGPVTATLRADENGRELLELGCDECADATLARLAGGSGRFANGKARIELSSLLPVGDHDLDLSLQEPNARDARSVRVVVPVHYRLRGDFSGLAEKRPELRVVVEAVKESAVVVDGRAIQLEASGKGVHRIDVTEELSGPSLSGVTLERAVPYTITTPGSAAQAGVVRLKIGVVPLQVTAPGASLVIEEAHFMLAGRTQAAGTVTVGGRPITVDTNGRFAQMMSVSTVGETTIIVRASAEQQAPRLFPLHVKRVQSLRAEAQAFSAGASQGLASIAADPDLKKGWKVVLTGTVAQTRSEHHTSISLLEVKQGCSLEPCLVRLIYGAEMPFTKGDSLRAFGHVLGAVDGPRTGSKIPEVRVLFFLSGRE